MDWENFLLAGPFSARAESKSGVSELKAAAEKLGCDCFVLDCPAMATKELLFDEFALKLGLAPDSARNWDALIESLVDAAAERKGCLLILEGQPPDKTLFSDLEDSLRSACESAAELGKILRFVRVIC